MIAYPHDAYFKSVMNDIEISIEFIKKNIPKAMHGKVDFKSLEAKPTTFIDSKLRQTHSDILFSANINKQTGYLYFLCEHQSTPDPDMPLRIADYTLKIIKLHQEAYPACKLFPIVCPFVLYTGLSPYRFPNDFSDYFDDPRLAEAVMFKSLNLIDLSLLPDQVILENKLSAAFQMVMKYYHSDELLEKVLLLEDHGLLTDVHGRNNGQQIQNLVKYMLNSPRIEDEKLVVSEMSKKSKELGEVGMSVAQQCHQRGLQEGVQQGMQQGIERGMEKGRDQLLTSLIPQMVQKGLSDNTISELTGLSIPELKNYK